MHTVAAITQILGFPLGAWLFVVITLVGIGVGLRDLSRFSLKRAWAIGSVCWSESIRRRVLLITPLAILGVIIVSQLQRPLDELDAIRQTTKFSLFATGLLVAVTTIILACTNLPREIDSRVIYTVVTKPTTRLEIVLGKVIGFARVSAMILVIMGLFTWGYLKFRAWNMQRDITARLADKPAAGSSVGTLEYYRDAGLLAAKRLETPVDLQMYSRLPSETGARRYVFGSGEGAFLIPFDVTPETLTPPGESEPGGGAGVLVQAYVGYVRSSGAATQPTAATQAAATTSPTTRPYYGPFILSPEERALTSSGRKSLGTPVVSIDVVDANENSIGPVTPLPPLKSYELTSPPDELGELRGVIEPRVARQMKGRVYLKISCGSDVEYFVDLAQTAMPIVMRTAAMGANGSLVANDVMPVKDAENPNVAAVICQTRSGTHGLQLKGGTEKEQAPIAVWRFKNADFVGTGDAPFELRTGIERSGAEDQPTEIAVNPTRVGVRVRNLTTQQISEETIVTPESRRTVFFRLPAAALAGGNFEVLMRCLTPGDYLGLQNTQGNRSLVLITARQPFAWNLAKSMLILWLLAILMTTVAIFTSTFLSWPIAVVLTIVILLGHWGVQQLGDAIQPGIGAQVVNDFGLKGSAKSEAVRATVERLSSFLSFISALLPDISQFPAVEDIERGIAIPAAKLSSSAAVTFGFGLPLILLAYVILKNKEVAP